MDKKINENSAFAEDIKRFKQIAEYKTPSQSLKHLYEYTFITSPQINEEGDEDDGEIQPQSDAQGQMQPDNGMNVQQNMQPDAQTQPMPNDMGQNAQMPQQDGAGQNVPMGGQGMDDTMTDEEPVDDGIETEEMEGDDEVIDVDELTQSQEATEYKIDGVDDRLAKIYKMVQDFKTQLDKNQEGIMALKDEFEKRNPTEEEKLNIRSQSSYPYSETPKDYWDNKVKENPHYNVMYNNDVPPSEEQKEFKITRDDIDGINMKTISDTLNVNQNLNDYLSF